MNHERHIHLIAWFHVILGILSLIALFITLIAGTAFGVFGLVLIDKTPAQEFFPVAGFFSVFFFIFLCCLALSAIPDLIVAWGLFNRKPWARYLAIILSAISLFNFPVGTALGLYTIWALWSEDAHAYFDRRYTLHSEYARY